MRINRISELRQQIWSMKSGTGKEYIPPHKVIMLIAVMEEIAAGRITNGFVPLNDSMVNAFHREWEKHICPYAQYKEGFAVTFASLSKEPFWTLMKTESFKKEKVYSLDKLRKSFFGAKLSDDMYEYMSDKPARKILMVYLLEKCKDGLSSKSLALYHRLEKNVYTKFDKSLLRFCQYYKGEKYCPQSDPDNQNFEIFWSIERMYFNDRYADQHLDWENYADKEFNEDFPEIAKHGRQFPKEIRGMLAFSAVDIMYHSPMGGVDFLNDYENKLYLMPYMPYYNAEPKNPYKQKEIRSTYWELEYIWLTQIHEVNPILEHEYKSNFFMDFEDCLSKVNDVIPTSLTAFLYEMYTHGGGTKYGFEKWYANYISLSDKFKNRK